MNGLRPDLESDSVRPGDKPRRFRCRRQTEAEAGRQQSLTGIFKKFSADHFGRWAYASFKYPVMTSA
jgi:hypothetical protein